LLCHTAWIVEVDARMRVVPAVAGSALGGKYPGGMCEPAAEPPLGNVHAAFKDTAIFMHPSQDMGAGRKPIDLVRYGRNLLSVQIERTF
jgi:hypothetical protein